MARVAYRLAKSVLVHEFRGVRIPPNGTITIAKDMTMWRPELIDSRKRALFSDTRAPGEYGLIAALVVSLVLMFAVACGSDSDGDTPSLPVGPATAQRAADVSATPTAMEPKQATPVPTQATVPTAQATATGTPKPQNTATPAPTTSPTPVPDSENGDSEADTSTAASDDMAAELAPECLTDGTLTDPKLVVSCSNTAMSALNGVKVDIEFNIGALFASMIPQGEEPPGIRMQVIRVSPDEFSMTMEGPDGEMLQFIVTGGAFYANDGSTDQWVKIALSADEMAEMLMSLEMVERQLQNLDDPSIVWKGVELSEDDSEYIVSYEVTPEQLGAQGPPLEIQLVLSASSFLHRSVSLLIPDKEAGTAHQLAELRYSGHNEQLEITAPENYIEGEAPLMHPSGSEDAVGQSGGPEVVALSKNSDGDVEVTFSEPVTVIGEIGLYVEDTPIGGWRLPYFEGSGTQTLTFNAADPGNPPLVPGESRILWFTFGAPESDLVGEDGQFAILDFDQWVYPE